MGADLADQLDDMELIAGDGGIVQLAHVPHLGDEAGYLVVVFYGFEHGLVGHVHAQLVSQLIHYLQLQLRLVVIEVVLVPFHGGVDNGGEELLVLYGMDEHEMLLHTLHGGAALSPEQGFQVVVASFNGPLQDRAHIGTVPGGHVIAGDIGGNTAGRPQPAGKTPRQVQQGLWYVVAVIAQSVLALRHSLGDQLVMRLLKQILKINKML